MQLARKGSKMKFDVRYSYNLDLLNLLNILTSEELYVSWHEGIYEQFGETLSNQSKKCMKEAVEINGSAMLGPQLSLVVSALPNFERKSILRLFSDTELLHEHFKQYGYYEAEEWPRSASLFGVLRPVVQELENKGFREYWRRERLPLIKRMQRQFRSFASQYRLDQEIELMLGVGQSPDCITVYLCTFAAPHGIKICGTRYITDVAFSKETSLGIAVHEMFHPPYEAKNLEKDLQKLGNDPLLKHAFKTKNPSYGYSTMEGFIEENVVEAMAIFICHKIGLEKDPLAYFAKHDDGSHMLSVVLFEYFKRYPKSRKQTFEEYFQELLKILPIGSLDREFAKISNS
jgi:hypothetical protein